MNQGAVAAGAPEKGRISDLFDEQPTREASALDLEMLDIDSSHWPLEPLSDGEDDDNVSDADSMLSYEEPDRWANDSISSHEEDTLDLDLEVQDYRSMPISPTCAWPMADQASHGSYGDLAPATLAADAVTPNCCVLDEQIYKESDAFLEAHIGRDAKIGGDVLFVDPEDEMLDWVGY